MTRRLFNARGARRLWHVVLGLAAAVIVLQGAALAWLKWHENELVFETARSHRVAIAPLPAGAEQLTLPTPSGVALAAVLLSADAVHDSGYWVLHLHGNADSAFSAAQLRHCAQLRALGLNVLAFDYRGYGRTPGAASEHGLYADAEVAYLALRQRGIAADHIILWGHSLGSGPAVNLATRYPAAALVLFGAFTSIPDAAADAYPYLAVRWVASIQFNSLQRLRAVHMPVIIAHSVTDTVIPLAHAEHLYAAANPPKRLLRLAVPFHDGMGGHVDALYDHLDQLVPLLRDAAGIEF